MKSNVYNCFLSIICCAFFLIENGQALEKLDPVVPHMASYAPPGGTDDLRCYLNQQYIAPHPVYCDRFYACNNGTPVMYQCEDGYGYHVEKQECKLLHLVQCGSRSKLQTPQGRGLCQRLNGLYADRDHGCEKYVNCGNGTAYPTACPGGLVFDDYHKYCKQPSDQDKQSCTKEPLVLGCGNDVQTGYSQTLCSTFKCPLTDKYPYGDYARYPNPIDCKSFIICLRDGSANVHGCQDNMLFSNIHYVCVNATQGANECFDTNHRTAKVLGDKLH